MFALSGDPKYCKKSCNPVTEETPITEMAENCFPSRPCGAAHPINLKDMIQYISLLSAMPSIIEIET